MAKVTTLTEDQAFGELLKEQVDLSFVMDAGVVIDWVRDNFAPEDVYEVSDLADWAEGNGFVEQTD